MQHWTEVFGNLATAAEIVAVAHARGQTVGDYLRAMYAELGAENPGGGWDKGREPDFDALGLQILQEACTHPLPHIFTDDGLLEWCGECGAVLTDHHLRKYGKQHPVL